MINRWQWISTQLSKKLWIKSAGFALGGVALAFVGILVEPYLPQALSLPTEQGSARNILNILASSMLAVTTFSLSIMITAFSGASAVSPRATDLLMADQTSHNVLAIFIGAFLFSLAGLIVLHMGFYDDRDELILFAVAIMMVVAVVIAILRWVDHLTKFGRMGDTINRLEQATIHALKDRLDNPFLGGVPLMGDNQIPHENFPVFATDIGYIDFFDAEKLERIADSSSAEFYIDALPGSFVHYGAPLLYASKSVDENLHKEIQAAFCIGRTRNFLQDPRFGITVMAEVACRAVAGDVSDSGTPIDLIGRMVRVLSHLKERESTKTAEVRFKRLHVPPINIQEYFDDFFPPVARDSGNLIEVHMRLHKALNALQALEDKEITQQVKRIRKIALEFAELSLTLKREITLLHKIANYYLETDELKSNTHQKDI